jgi:two-component system cell cycle response regulator DivK
MRRPLSILVVDDDAASLYQMGLQLEAAGFEVKSLSSAVETLDYLRGARRPPDLVLLDLWMPGVHGVALAQSIKSDPRLRAIPLCAITGYAYNEEEVRRTAGVEGFLNKPLPWGDELRATLTGLIAQARGREAGFVPLAEAAQRLGLSVAETRQRLYVVVVDRRPAVRAEDVTRLEQLSAAPDYARALQLAFDRRPWRDLNWHGRTVLFNRGLPPELHVNRRALNRITLGRDKELARAIRVLLALELKLGLSLRDLYCGVAELEGEDSEQERG